MLPPPPGTSLARAEVCVILLVMLAVLVFFVDQVYVHLGDGVDVMEVVQAVGNGEARESSAPRRPACAWVFDRYESSSMELDWLEEVSKSDRDGGKMCYNGTLFTPPRAEVVFRALKLAQLLSNRSWHAISIEDYMLFSRFYYRLSCPLGQQQPDKAAPTKGVQLVEPLYGILRDPCDTYCDTLNKCPDDVKAATKLEYSQSKAHMLLLVDAPFYLYSSNVLDPLKSLAEWTVGGGIAPWHCRSLEPCKETKGIFMDLGASQFEGWKKDKTAFSQKFLYSRYHLRNVVMREMYAVELQTLDPKMIFSMVPLDLAAHYHWINVGVNAIPGDKLNPWTILKQLKAQQVDRDCTIVKLDIDAPSIETALVDQLLADQNGTMGTIDEFFYEHHVRTSPMFRWWRTQGSPVFLADSYEMFLELRKLGIRAHSWP